MKPQLSAAERRSLNAAFFNTERSEVSTPVTIPPTVLFLLRLIGVLPGSGG